MLNVDSGTSLLLSAENLKCHGGFFSIEIISCKSGKIILTQELLELSLGTVLCKFSVYRITNRVYDFGFPLADG